jgi:imidazolonepropionase-like amidohydrolase
MRLLDGNQMKKQIIAAMATACVCFAIPSAHAKQPSHSNSGAGAAITVFKDVRVIDGTGAPATEHQYLIIEGDKVKSITSEQPKGLASGARVIDAHDKTIMPALVLGHAHLGLLKGTSTTGSNITEANDIRQLKQYGKYGVCLVMSLGDDHDCIYDIRNKRNRGSIGGPYVMTAGHGIGVPNGAPPLETGADQIYRPTTIAEALKEVDDLARHSVDIIKIWVDDIGGTAEKMKPEMYKAIIAEAHSHGLKVAAHVWYLADAKSLIDAGVDVLAHSIRDLPVDDQLISAMKSHNVAITPTLAVDDSFFIFKEHPEWMNSKFFQDSLEPGILEYLESDKYVPSERERKAKSVAQHNLKALYDSGVNVAFGTDSGGLERPQGFEEHRELELMVDSGLTPLQAIQCATRNSAAFLGVSERMGTLAAGKLANLIVLDADPSVDIKNTRKINSVWIDGREQR